MLFNKVLFCLASLSMVLSLPIPQRSDRLVVARVPKAEAPASATKAPPSKSNTVEQYQGREVLDSVPRFNYVPSTASPGSTTCPTLLRKYPPPLRPRKLTPHPSQKPCQGVSDCSCPAPADPNAFHSTSCINGFCQCDNPVVNLMSNVFMDAVIAIGNAPITQAIGNLMQGVADVTEVAGIIAGAVLGPEAKVALKAALLAFPDTGPSHIDQATKGILVGALG